MEQELAYSFQLSSDKKKVTKENYEKFDNMLKSIDEEYRTTLINL